MPNYVSGSACSRLKPLLFFVLLLRLSSGFCQTSTLTGTVLAPQQPYLYFYVAGQLDSTKVENGKFKKTFPSTTGLFLTLRSGRQRLPLFIGRNETLPIAFEEGKLLTTLQGKGAYKQRVQYFVSKDRFSDSLYSDAAFRDLNSSEKYVFLKRVDSLHACLLARLDAYFKETGKRDQAFYNLEKASLRYFTGHIKLNYSHAHQVYTKEKLDETDSNFYAFTTAIDRDNSQYLNLFDEFSSYVTNYVFYKSALLYQSDSAYKGLKLGGLKAQMDAITQHFKNQAVKNYLYYHSMDMYLHFEDAGIDFSNMVRLFNAVCTSDSLKAALNHTYTAKVLLAKGKPAPDFTVRDKEGKTISLRDLKGQWVLVDVWASWCGPCLKELPYLDTLKAKFRSDPITFLTISIDEDEGAWRKVMEKRKMSEHQYTVSGGFNSELCKSYLIKAIPQYILIDKDGLIVQSNAPEPSNPKLQTLLEAQLQTLLEAQLQKPFSPLK